MNFEDADYEDMAFLKQLCVFRPMAPNYQEFADDLRLAQLATAIHYIESNQLDRANRAHSGSTAVMRKGQKIPAKNYEAR